MASTSYGQGLKRRVLIMLITAVISFVVIAAALLMGGRSYLQTKMAGWHEWARFDVPPDALPLRASISTNAQGQVTVCNHDSGPWTHPLIRITDDYLATVNRIDSGTCKVFARNDFRTNSWKRLPPPQDLVIDRVEVLTDVTRPGYVQHSEK